MYLELIMASTISVDMIKKQILIEQINHLDSNILSICVISDPFLKYLTQLNCTQK